MCKKTVLKFIQKNGQAQEMGAGLWNDSGVMSPMRCKQGMHRGRRAGKEGGCAHREQPLAEASTQAFTF